MASWDPTSSCTYTAKQLPQDYVGQAVAAIVMAAAWSRPPPLFVSVRIYSRLVYTRLFGHQFDNEWHLWCGPYARSGWPRNRSSSDFDNDPKGVPSAGLYRSASISALIFGTGSFPMLSVQSLLAIRGADD